MPQEQPDYVLKELERLGDQMERMSEKLGLVQQDVAAIKAEQRVRAGIFGTLGGAIVAGFFKLMEMGK